MKIELLLPIKDINMQFFILAFLVACLEMFYQECLKPRMIFSSFGKFIDRLDDLGGVKRKIAYILGYCAFCNGFYVSLVVYLLYFKSLNLTLLLFAGLFYIFFRILITLFSYQK